MKPDTKGPLIAVAVMLAICALAAVGTVAFYQYRGQLFYQMTGEMTGETTEDPAEILALGRQIVHFELPPGYSCEAGGRFPDFTMVTLASNDGSMVIMLTEYDAPTMDLENPGPLLEETLYGEIMPEDGIEITGSLEVTMNGRPVTLTVGEGRFEEDELLRLISGSFKSPGGIATLMISGPVSGWDEKGIDTFLNSLE